MQTERISAARHSGLWWWRDDGVLGICNLFVVIDAILGWLLNVILLRGSSSVLLVLLGWCSSRRGSIVGSIVVVILKSLTPLKSS